MTEVSSLASVTFCCNILERFKCGACRRLMECPMQTECGHMYCNECLKAIVHSGNPVCVIDQEPVSIETSFPDIACKRDIDGLEVKCSYSEDGCDWTGALKRMSDHKSECNLRDIQCDLCGAHLKYRAKDDHLQNVCPMRKVNCAMCNELVTHDQLGVHWERDCKKYLHHCPNSCDADLLMTADKLTEHLDKTMGDCPLVEIECPYSAFGCNYTTMRKNITKHLESSQLNHLFLHVGTFSLEKKFAEYTSGVLVKLAEEIEELESRSNSLEQDIEECRDAQDNVRRSLTSFEETSSRNYEAVKKRLASMHKDRSRDDDKTMGKLKELERNTKLTRDSISVNLSTIVELGRRVEDIEHVSHNGVMVFKISSFATYLQYAKDKCMPFILSHPFYTGLYGYKLAVQVFPNGNGEGLGTHVGVFLVVMKGEFNNVLKWPFDRIFTVSILNQDGKSDESINCEPGKSSVSFEKPKNKMNTGSGIPNLLSHDKMYKEGFVKDDCMFVKVSVHPAA